MDVEIQAENAAIAVTSITVKKIVATLGSARPIFAVHSVWISSVSIFALGSLARAPGRLRSNMLTSTSTLDTAISGVVVFKEI